MMRNMLPSFKGLSLQSTRTISSTIVPAMRVNTALAAPTKKTASPGSKQKDALKAKLLKERTTLKNLEKKLKTETKKLDSKQQTRAKAELAAATKPYRKLSGYTFFIRSEKGNKFVDSAAKWKSLSDSEKYSYSQDAAAYNDEQLQIYTPKPKKPATGYALYLKENYVNDGRTIGEIGKDLSARWRALSDGEKARYDVSQTLKDDYAKKLQQWTEDRLKIYKSKSA